MDYKNSEESVKFDTSHVKVFVSNSKTGDESITSNSLKSLNTSNDEDKNSI